VRRANLHRPCAVVMVSSLSSLSSFSFSLGTRRPLVHRHADGDGSAHAQRP
jgi:hypothetical protein